MNKEDFLKNIQKEQLEKKSKNNFNLWALISNKVKKRSLLIMNILLGLLLFIVLLIATTVEALYNMGYSDKNLQNVGNLSKLVNDNSLTTQIELISIITSHRSEMLLIAIILSMLIIAITVALNYFKHKSKKS